MKIDTLTTYGGFEGKEKLTELTVDRLELIALKEALRRYAEENPRAQYMFEKLDTYKEKE